MLLDTYYKEFKKILNDYTIDNYAVNYYYDILSKKSIKNFIKRIKQNTKKYNVINILYQLDNLVKKENI